MFKSLIVVCRGSKDIFDKKNFQLSIFYKFVIVNQNLGLAPDPDTYRIGSVLGNWLYPDPNRIQQNTWIRIRIQ
jgi:hypothetical protein